MERLFYKNQLLFSIKINKKIKQVLETEGTKTSKTTEVYNDYSFKTIQNVAKTKKLKI